MFPTKINNDFDLPNNYFELFGPPCAVSGCITKADKSKLTNDEVFCNTVFFKDKVHEEIKQKIPLSFSDFKLER